jgi:nicotinamide phosphoribosyltransferase
MSGNGAAVANGGGGGAAARAPPPPPPQPGCLPNGVPISVLTDSYKATHFLQYPPDVQRLVAYGEFRAGLKTDDDDGDGGDRDGGGAPLFPLPSTTASPAAAAAAAAIASPPAKDTRFVWFGIRYIVEQYLCRRWTEADVAAAAAFFATHRAPGQTPFPFPRDLFLRFVRENRGYFPVTLRALPEGTVAHARVPVYQIEAEAPYAPLCTFLETLLTTCWYPATVATLSRRVRDAIERAFELSGGDLGADDPLVPSRLHDFGMRACTCVEQSVLGGCAHLLSFDGTDTLPAAFYAQFSLNGGRPVGGSIPATEHSVMTAWPDEAGAVLNMIERFGDGAFACVMDSYDYGAALKEVLPAVAGAKSAKGPGGFMVLRPDSGDPADAVVEALEACARVFGCDANAKGFKVLRGCGVIQGDGMTPRAVRRVLARALAAGFSASNVAFGMGGGLLQKVNRDSMSFATKLCRVDVKQQQQQQQPQQQQPQDAAGAGAAAAAGAGAAGAGAGGGAAASPPSSSLSGRDVMKRPRTDPSKASFPGRLAVKRVDGVPTVFPADGGEVAPEEDMLRVVYACGPVVGGGGETGAANGGGGDGKKQQQQQQQQRWEDFDALRARVAREWRALPPYADPISASLRAKMAAFRPPPAAAAAAAAAAAGAAAARAAP